MYKQCINKCIYDGVNTVICILWCVFIHYTHVHQKINL